MINLNSKSVLVTGADGFLGGHILEVLQGRCAEIIGLTHDVHRDSYASSQNLDIAHWVKGDITDPISLRRIIADYEVEYVFHLAANPIVRKCALNPIGCFETNIMGTVKVLEAARLAGTVRGVLCMESDKSYGSFAAEDLPYKEDQALKPTNVYEVSKACAGFVAKAYDYNYGLPTFTIRGANLYGPGDMNLSRLIPGSILRVLNGEPPVIYGGVENYIREFIYVHDAAEICVRLMEGIEQTRGHAINLGTGDTHRIADLMELICIALGTDLEPKIIDKSQTFKEIEKQWLDLTKLNSFIGDYGYTQMEEGLQKTISWYRKFLKAKSVLRMD